VTAPVGIVIVSHSPKVAEGTADMVRQMVGEDVRCAWTGGDPAGGLGADPERIRAAIEAAAGAGGAAVLVDLGGAEMNAEVAIEALPPERAKLVRICRAPLVEGAVVAAAEAAGGADLAAVCAAAEAFRK
jgi:dihydroxyacetone kinase phosphotransfer subunit